MDIITILKIIAIVLQLIATGLSENEAIYSACAKFGVSENFIRKFM